MKIILKQKSFLVCVLVNMCIFTVPKYVRAVLLGWEFYTNTQVFSIHSTGFSCYLS